MRTRPGHSCRSTSNSAPSCPSGECSWEYFPHCLCSLQSILSLLYGTIIATILSFLHFTFETFETGDYQFRAIPWGLPVSPTSFYSKYPRVFSSHPSLLVVHRYIHELLPVDSSDDDFLIVHSNPSIDSDSDDFATATPYPTSSNFVAKKPTLLNHVFSRVICLCDPAP